MKSKECEKAIYRFITRFKSESININQKDKEALNDIIKYYNSQQEQIVKTNATASKLIVLVLRKIVENRTNENGALNWLLVQDDFSNIMNCPLEVEIEKLKDQFNENKISKFLDDYQNGLATEKEISKGIYEPVKIEKIKSLCNQTINKVLNYD